MFAGTIGRTSLQILRRVLLAGANSGGDWVHGRGLFAPRALFVAALSLVALALLSPTASASDRQTDLVSIGPNGGNGAADAQYGGASADGSHVYFMTTESLVSADTDSSNDVYERVGSTVTLISTGPTGGNGAYDAQFAGVSPDGTHVFFETKEQLASTDTDSASDVYDRSGGVTTEVSVSAIGGNSAIDSFWVGTSTDGTKVFFESYDKLTSDDTDTGRQDVYERSGGAVTLLSTGGNGAYGASFDGATPDGTHVFFHTDESLAPTDTDGVRDVYEHSGGTTRQVSTGPINGNGAFEAYFRGVSQDGSRAFFDTDEPLTTSDTDSYRDVYERSGGVTTNLSLGPNGGNGAFDANFTGASADGSKVWFETREPLVIGDTDGRCEDEFEQFVLPCTDVYERSGGNTTLISAGGNGSNDASFGGASADGSHVFFQTTESLSAADPGPSNLDVYDRSGGNTTLVSVGNNQAAFFNGSSKDGARVFFSTYGQVVSEDTDIWNDVYERYSGATTLVSTGPASTSGNNFAFYYGNSDDGTKVFFDTDEKLTSSDTDSQYDVYSSSTVVAGYPRPKGATPATFALVPAYQQCLLPNSTHGAPLAYNSCTPPTQDSGVLTIGSPDANGHAASSNSQVKFRLAGGGTDVEFSTRITDVLCRTTNPACPNGPLSDFAGRLLIRATLRLTDRYNGSPAVESATVQELDVQMPIQCVATALTNTGGDCSGGLSVNAAYPGAVTAGQRAIWQIQKVVVLDPGPNGTGFGSGCPATCGDGDETAFMRPGIFVP
jgi:hypothetical protein